MKKLKYLCYKTHSNRRNELFYFWNVNVCWLLFKKKEEQTMAYIQLRDHNYMIVWKVNNLFRVFFFGFRWQAVNSNSIHINIKRCAYFGRRIPKQILNYDLRIKYRTNANSVYNVYRMSGRTNRTNVTVLCSEERTNNTAIRFDPFRRNYIIIRKQCEYANDECVQLFIKYGKCDEKSFCLCSTIDYSQMIHSNKVFWILFN